MPRKPHFAKLEEKRGGGQRKMCKMGGENSPTTFAHINTHNPTILGGTLGRPVLGKSLTCDLRLGMRLVGSGKRAFDTTNILMLRKKQPLPAQGDWGPRSRQQQANRGTNYPCCPVFRLPPVFPGPPLCPSVFPHPFLAFSCFPPFSHANAKIFSLASGFQGFGAYRPLIC